MRRNRQGWSRLVSGYRSLAPVELDQLGFAKRSTRSQGQRAIDGLLEAVTWQESKKDPDATVAIAGTRAMAKIMKIEWGTMTRQQIRDQWVSRFGLRRGLKW